MDVRTCDQQVVDALRTQTRLVCGFAVQCSAEDARSEEEDEMSARSKRGERALHTSVAVFALAALEGAHSALTYASCREGCIGVTTTDAFYPQVSVACDTSDSVLLHYVLLLESPKLWS